MKDKRSPRGTKLETVYHRALELFQHDKDKMLRWYLTKRPEWDDMSPYELCKAGKARRILKILNQLLAQ